MELDKFYERGSESGGWVRALPPPPEIQRGKVCKDCRQRISGVFRYGRCLNKINLDLSERNFMTLCNRDLAKFDSELDKLKELAAETLNKHGLTIKDIMKVKSAATTVCRKYNFLSTWSKRPPKVQLYERTEAAIERAARLKEWSAGVKALHKQALALPRLDFSPYVRALIGVGMCGMPWMEGHICHLHYVINKSNTTCFPRHLDADRKKDEQLKQVEFSRQIRQLMTEGDVCLQYARDKLVDACSTAFDRMIIAKGVQACKALMYMMIHEYRFVGELKGFSVAVALHKDPREHNKEQEDIQKNIVREALEVGKNAKEMMEQQWGDNARVNPKFQEIESICLKIKRLNSQEQPSRTEVLQILSAVIERDRTIGNFAEGHCYTCPNGHIYIIGECGRAMEESSCPECGARIGGRSHTLVANNRQETNIAQELRQLRMRR